MTEQDEELVPVEVITFTYILLITLVQQPNTRWTENREIRSRRQEILGRVHAIRTSFNELNSA